ncbi:hypothetical protein [Lactobacillus ginsenosidimutans] [Lactiplantibacillus mudanjiangensis]|uniref:helix-turn-helix transcriptional regulator n=1 Tax=Lactiplantibacillus mudanjiangensis TaxID=1296538 RepID=UPI001014E986|nr:hypothetical protein [Lactobacillus ginsenosidimutans] [Lactiplantibacillus mudanjiangensis]
MTKTARINTMMRYINNRQYFTIRELMTQFKVSRSTVIRDLNNIQELGMPLTASVGRDGGYAVMQNQLLPAVQFNSEELKALFVSFLATLNTQLPYLQNRNTLTEKLVAIASQTQQDDLLTLQELLIFDQTNPRNPKLTELTDFAPPMLKQLLNMCLTSRQLIVTLAERDYRVWVQHFYTRQATWLLEAWDLNDQVALELTVSDILQAKPLDHAVEMDDATITAAIKAAQPTPNVQLQLKTEAIQRFRQQPHPTSVLEFLDPFQQTARFTCYLDVRQSQLVTDFAAWVTFLGPTAQLTQAPAELITAITTLCTTMLNQLS